MIFDAVDYYEYPYNTDIVACKDSTKNKTSILSLTKSKQKWFVSFMSYTQLMNIA